MVPCTGSIEKHMELVVSLIPPAISVGRNVRLTMILLRRSVILIGGVVCGHDGRMKFMEDVELR